MNRLISRFRGIHSPKSFHTYSTRQEGKAGLSPGGGGAGLQFTCVQGGPWPVHRNDRSRVPCTFEKFLVRNPGYSPDWVSRFSGGGVFLVSMRTRSQMDTRRMTVTASRKNMGNSSGENGMSGFQTDFNLNKKVHKPCRSPAPGSTNLAVGLSGCGKIQWPGILSKSRTLRAVIPNGVRNLLKLETPCF